MDIREGHAVTVDKVLRWITEDGSVKGASVCDAGMLCCLRLLYKRLTLRSIGT